MGYITPDQLDEPGAAQASAEGGHEISPDDLDPEPTPGERFRRGVDVVTSGVAKGITGLAESLINAPGDILSAAQTILPFATGTFVSEGKRRLPDFLRGAAQGATLGLAPVEPTDEEIARGGRITGASALGMGAAKALTPLSEMLVRALGPMAGKTAAKGIELGMQGGAAATGAAIHGGDPMEAFVAGMTAPGVASTITGLSNKTLKLAASPAKQATVKEVEQHILDAREYTDWKFRQDMLSQTRQRNAAAIEHYKQEVAAAQAAAAQKDPAAMARYENAMMSLRAAQRLSADMESTLAEQTKFLRPKMTPEEAYAEYNMARETTPDILPTIQLKQGADTLSQLGGGLSATTEGLPKSVKPAGRLEKIATQFGMGKSFAENWAKVSPDDKVAANEHYVKQFGITGDDLARISSGKLRLDEADRVLQLIGPNAATSGLASKIYWSIMEDLRKTNDPMVQGFVKAKQVSRQDIAASDVARILRPVPDKFGRETISESGFKKLTSMFRNYERDPNLLTWDEKLLVESIPATERAPLLQLFKDVFILRSAVAEAQAIVKETRPGRVAAEKIPRPRMEKPLLKPRPQSPDVPLEWRPESQTLQQYDSMTYAAMRMSGLPIPESIGLSRLLGVYPRYVFKAGLTPTGRDFVRALYGQGGRTNLNDMNQLTAIANYVRAADDEAKRRSQMSMNPAQME